MSLLLLRKCKHMSNDNHENEVLILKALSVQKKKELLKGLGLTAQLPTILNHMNDEDRYTIQDVAEFLGYSPQHVRRLCRQDKLHAIQAGSRGKYIILGQYLKEFIVKYLYREKTWEKFFNT